MTQLSKTLSITTCTVLSLAWLTACSTKPTAAAGTPAAETAALQPVSSHAAATSQATAEGPVLETMDAGNYTYVRVKGPSGDVWAATSTFKVKVGDQVIVPLENPMENFHSATLNRDFPLIYFAAQIPHAGAAGTEPMQVIPPSGGSVTVAHIVTNRKTLAGQTVTVRGKVVKYNGGILGLNWLHIQDGSGAEKDGTNDLTVTSASAAAVGDIVTITGTVVIDKDFGAGYAYEVLLQNATIAVK